MAGILLEHSLLERREPPPIAGQKTLGPSRLEKSDRSLMILGHNRVAVNCELHCLFIPDKWNRTGVLGLGMQTSFSVDRTGLETTIWESHDPCDRV